MSRRKVDPDIAIRMRREGKSVTEIAKFFGASHVAALRAISGYSDYRPLKNKPHWTDEEIAAIGTGTDAAVAGEIGRTQKAVMGKRQKLGAETPQRRQLFTAAEIALLGTMPDSELAKKIGRTVKAVRKAREFRRIFAFRRE